MLDARCSRRGIQRFKARAFSFITNTSMASWKKKTLAEGLLAIPRYSRRRRAWSKMKEEQIVEYAMKVMKENGVNGRGELSKIDSGLYGVLRKRGLLDNVGFVEKKRRKQRSWKDMSDEEIVEYAMKVMKENGVNGRGELEKIDYGLYNVLRRRGLIGRIGLDEKQRSWSDISDGEIVEYARRVMEEEKITGRKELQDLDPGFYLVLRRRELLDEVGFEEKRRAWKDMSDEEVVDYARQVMKENGISGRKELQKTDSGLYEILRKRGLLEQAFADADQQKTDKERDAVIDALTKFANEKQEVGVA